MSTKERILEKALKMFNERGIEYVGLRELAAILEMRVSNITYYFPTKDDLVLEIAHQLRQKNSQVMVETKDLTLGGFLEMIRHVFEHHLEFRCLLLSFVHVIEQNKLVAASYKKTQSTRNATIAANIETLMASGYLNTKDEKDRSFLVSSIALMSRFWISEATISFRNLSAKAQMTHYLELIARLLIPYATSKGKKEIKTFIEELAESK